MTSLPPPTAYSTRPIASWLVPYDQQVIDTPLAPDAVRAQLAATFEELNTPPKQSIFSTAARYEGHIEQDHLTVSGPHANRRFCLLTRGFIQSDPAGTRIALTLRLSTGYTLLTVLQLAFLWGWALAVGFPAALALPMSVFLYVATTLMCRYEASQIVAMLLRAAGPPPSAEAQGAIVPDGVGWRCGSCGGYVRQDATFCKHCKRPFLR